MATLSRRDTPLGETFSSSSASANDVTVGDDGFVIIDFDTGNGVGSVALQVKNRLGNWVPTGNTYTSSGAYMLVCRGKNYRVDVTRSSGSIDVEIWP